MELKKWKLVLAFLLTCAAGALLHFVYQWLPSPLTALIAPVNESLWEHGKIIFWPYLAAALILNRGRSRESLRPWLLSAVLLVALMLSVGYLYHIVLSGEAMVFDLVLFAVLMALGFLLPHLFPGPWDGFAWELAAWLAAALGVALVLFSFWPPSGVLFTDLSGAPTWVTIPC